MVQNRYRNDGKIYSREAFQDLQSFVKKKIGTSINIHIIVRRQFRLLVIKALCRHLYGRAREIIMEHLKTHQHGDT